MAPTLGKRKRVTREELERPSRSASPSSGSGEDSGAEDLQAIFQRAFEAKFKPLPIEPKKPKIEETRIEEEDEDSEQAEAESDWSGISSADDDAIEVIEYNPTLSTYSPSETTEKKVFMSSKPPTSTQPRISTATTTKKTADPDTELTNLKNDHALQKLLRDSHLLSASPTPTLTATGVARHKSTDLHLQSLGAKGSVFTQKKMPMAQRKHMVQKARLGEEKRRALAKEAGIVLEREQRDGNGNGKAEREKRRERGVGAPSVGRFRGGTLMLSRGDVRSITGGRGRGGNGKGKGKGMKGKRGGG
ncbi:hypothetical protein BDW02DRAFT_601001 [Decorospora gaudefroyi]|uniref:Uncharacterized protein n=1 Tax=Decorospora gaudefroyi TaxID=184978 RepID=A0A6A5K8C4_9PLEO|nr:hypothetical protein BDW02DRAFT_601001 [Decorospora gaudefroyi]